MTMQFNVSLPKKPRPIIVIGAGGIVNDAHLPAYQIAGFKVAGIFDINIEKAKNTAKKFSIPVVYENMEQLLDQDPFDVVYDIALPANKIIGVLQELPDGAAVLIQKPMGENYEQAKNSIDNMVYDRNFLQIIREVVNVSLKRLVMFIT